MLNMKSKIFKYIYAMLCLLPAIAVGVTCLYVANNDNAYESYSGNVVQNDYINTSYSTNDSTFPIRDVYFSFNRSIDITSFGTSRVELYFTDIEYVEGSLNATQIATLEVASFIRLWYDDGYSSNYCTWNDLGTNLGGGQNFTIKATFDNFNNLPSTADVDLLYRVIDLNGLDNVFYYSLDKVENSSVFSWVKSNFLYSGVNQFVGIFGGTNSNISFYLTWVLTISLCYLGFEVLMLFINMARNLIHAFQTKEW